MTGAFWEWSLATYARPGVEPLLLKLQDAHRLDVNLLLWCLWCAAKFDQPPDFALRKAFNLSTQWSLMATAPLRRVRRDLKTKNPLGADEIAGRLRAHVKAAELAAEEALQSALEKLARASLSPVTDRAGTHSRARRTLAAYVRLTDAARTPGFSISLLEDLIELTLAASDSDTGRVQ